jgi:hypothetical protein
MEQGSIQGRTTQTIEHGRDLIKGDQLLPVGTYFYTMTEEFTKTKVRGIYQQIKTALIDS